MLSLAFKQWQVLTLALLCLCFWTLDAHAQRESSQRQSTPRSAEDGPVRFNKIEEVVATWSEDKRIYISGQVDVAPEMLKELKRWLADNGPHWTVVIMENTENQRYTLNGTEYKGLDAVEQALGNGLSNRTGFGNLRHPTTHETDGTILSISLRDRALDYFSSEAQDRRRLGESDWKGNLDAPAIRAMRGGGRVVLAVQDTVKLINSRLQAALDEESRNKQQQAIELERAVSALKRMASDAHTATLSIESSSKAYVGRYEKASGPLAQPPVAKWLEQLDELQNQLNAKTVRELEPKLNRLQSELDRYLNAYAAAESIEKQEAQIQNRLVSLQKSDSQPLRQLGDEIVKAQEEIKRHLQDGDFEFETSVNRVDQLIERSEATLAEVQRAKATADIQARIIRGTLMAIGVLLALVAGIVLVIMNQRRKVNKDKAEKALSETEAAVARETDNIDVLFQRNHDLLGSPENIKQRGYEGLTRDVALQTFEYVDDLFIMSREVKRVIANAKSLIYPDSIGQKFANLFSSTNYLQAINHISGRPLKFTRVTGIPLILHNWNKQEHHALSPSQPTAASGSNEIPVATIVPSPDVSATSNQKVNLDEISLTFDQIFAAFKKRGVEAEQSLNRIEKCLTDVQDKLTQSQSKIERAAQQEQALQHASSSDGMLSVPNYFNVLLPAARTLLKNADQLSTFDAVRAMEGPLQQLDVQLNEAQLLGDHLNAAREELFPKMRNESEGLRKREIATAWIDSELKLISQFADETFAKAAQASVAEQVEAVADRLHAIGQRTEHALQLAEWIQDQRRPETEQLKQRIMAARSEAARKLRINEAQALHEHQRDPDQHLMRAQSSLDTAIAMLNQGNDQAAQAAQETCINEVQAADAILQATQDALSGFDSRTSNIQRSLTTTNKRVPELGQGIETARRAYADSALLVQQAYNAGDIDGKTSSYNAAENKSVDWLLSEAQSLSSLAQQNLSTAQSEHQKGRVLAAVDLLDQCDSDLKVASEDLDQIHTHLERLANQSRENQLAQQHNESLHAELKSAANDPLVTQDTLQAIDQVALTLVQNRSAIDTPQAAPNPFETARSIMELRKQLEMLKAQIVGDRQAHAEATRAAQGAAQQLDVANRLVRQSQTDSIPDSAQITQTNQSISGLANQLREIENALHVRHGDWRSVDARAARLQADLARAAQTLGQELSAAQDAFVAFQQASKQVINAQQWSGPWGIRVSGTNGVRELEQARRGLQTGNYSVALQISRAAMMAAQIAIQQAEREVAMRQMEEEHRREEQRRREAIARESSNRSFGGGSRGFSVDFGRGGSSSTSSSSSSSASPGSGFSRSTW